MRIVIFNWRDVSNPLAGGAEVLLQESARRWIAEGHSVSWITSRFPGSSEQETIDGVQIFRTGNSRSVYWKAAHLFKQKFAGQSDLVIDTVNTLPFFTPWFVKEPIVMHFNQLAREVWFYECPWPMAVVGFLLEPVWLKIYRKIYTVTISRSSRLDLLRLGFAREQVQLLPMPTKPYATPPADARAQTPTFIYLGRLKRSKRVHHALIAFVRVRARIPNSRLWIVGDGDRSYRDYLKKMVERFGLGSSVTFFGQVPEQKKEQLLQEAHALVVPSVREGWGIVVNEANSKGTPAIVYPVPGLVDSIDNQVTGLVCSEPTPRALADQMIDLAENKALWKRLSMPKNFSRPAVSWDDTARSYLQFLRHRMGEKSAPADFSKLSIVIPGCLWNGTVQSGLQEAARLADHLQGKCEILVVAELSDERLPVLLKQRGISEDKIRQIAPDRFLGESYALVLAARKASGDMLLYLDPNADISTGELIALIESWRAAPTDLVVASRRHGEDWRRRPWLWRLFSDLYHAAVRRLFGAEMGDVQTGIKLFRTEILRHVLQRLVVKEYAFDMELLAVAHRAGFTIAVRPIRVLQGTSQRRAHLLDMFHLFMDTLSIWYRMFCLRYYDRPIVVLPPKRTVSIVIPCKAPTPYLTECLQACSELDYPKQLIQIIVLTDESAQISSPQVLCVPTGPVGPGKKRDLALSHCTGEIVAFIDDDTVPRWDWLRNAVRWFEDERIGAVGGPAPTPATDSLRRAASGAVYSSWLVAGTQSYRYFPAVGRWVDDYPSCNLFIRKEVLTQVGGFDTAFWPGEDTILCAKITQDLKKKIWYDPDAVVYHHRRALFRGHLYQIQRYAEHRGYFVKRYPATSLRVPYFLPSCLVFFFIFGALLSVLFPPLRTLYTGAVLVYLALVMLWAALSLNIRMAVLVFFGIIASHWAYGIYFLKGLLSTSMAEEFKREPV